MTIPIEHLIDDVIRREGGFVDHPADRGGPTKFGITEATLTRHLGHPATTADVRALERATAEAIYRRDYFEAPQIDRLPGRIQPAVFDSAVNHGPARAIRFVQRVCNEAAFGPLIEDGICGPRTQDAAAAAERLMGAWLVAALVEERRMFYHAIVDHDPSQRVFLEGWLTRLAEFDVPRERLVA